MAKVKWTPTKEASIRFRDKLAKKRSERATKAAATRKRKAEERRSEATTAKGPQWGFPINPDRWAKDKFTLIFTFDVSKLLYPGKSTGYRYETIVYRCRGKDYADAVQGAMKEFRKSLRIDWAFSGWPESPSVPIDAAPAGVLVASFEELRRVFPPETQPNYR